MLVGNRVIKAMAKTFEDSEGKLAERLIKALEAGQEAGGDKRGKTSAALVVANREQNGSHSFIDFKVGCHQNPVKELRRIFNKCSY